MTGKRIGYPVRVELVGIGPTGILIPLTITGGAISVTPAPATVLSDLAPVVAVNAVQTAIVPVNASRRSVTLSADPSATAVVYARKHGGANNLMPMQPGIAYVFPGTYAIDVRNDTGANVNIYILEQS